MTELALACLPLGESMYTHIQSELADNKLLSALPHTERERLQRYLRRVKLPFGKVVHEPGTTRRDVYFPIDCVFSKQFVTADGGAVEVASVGREGLVGVPLLLGCTGTPIRTVVQVAGSAWCGPGAELHQELTRDPALQNLVLRFTQALMIEMGQNATCYQHHSVEQQLCLWLLLMQDRTGSTHLRFTQDLIAQTLGVRRESVNEAIQRLAGHGIVRNGRGSIEVLDRAGLEAASCDCYRVITREYARLLP